jgi:hypothetical protein
MGTINDWAGAIGGTILGIELLVALLILVVINAGIAYGLWWVAKKMGLVHEKRVWLQGLIQKWTDRATSVAAEPVIRSTSAWRGLKAGLYRATHWPRRLPSSAVPAAIDAAAGHEKTTEAA